VHNKYTAADFDEDLRQLLRRAGCKDEKICFLLDESNVLESGFYERMNTLLANGEVSGLFEGDEYATLMTQCKEGAQREGLMLEGEELYKWYLLFGFLSSYYKYIFFIYFNFKILFQVHATGHAQFAFRIHDESIDARSQGSRIDVARFIQPLRSLLVW